MNGAEFHTIKNKLLKYGVFMIPAMLIASKGFADLWIAGLKQPYIALTLLMLAIVSAIVFLTLASTFLYLSHRQHWIPPGKLILLVAGIKLFFDVSLGTTVGLEGLAISIGLWLLWGFLAYRKNRNGLER